MLSRVVGEIKISVDYLCNIMFMYVSVGNQKISTTTVKSYFILHKVC